MRAILAILTSAGVAVPAGFGFCRREVVVERPCAPPVVRRVVCDPPPRVVCAPPRRVEFVRECPPPARVTRVVVTPRCPPRPRCVTRVVRVVRGGFCR